MGSRLVITALLTAGVCGDRRLTLRSLTRRTPGVERNIGGGKGGGGATAPAAEAAAEADDAQPDGYPAPGGRDPTPPVRPVDPPFEPGPPEVANEPEPEVVQEARQLKEGELPFTGFAAVPLLLFGIAFLAGGLALRHTVRARQGTPQI